MNNNEIPVTKFTARFPKALHVKIAALAKAESRSVNSQIVHMIQQSLAAKK